MNQKVKNALAYAKRNPFDAWIYSVCLFSAAFVFAALLKMIAMV